MGGQLQRHAQTLPACVQLVEEVSKAEKVASRKDYYQILQVQRSSGLAEVKRACKLKRVGCFLHAMACGLHAVHELMPDTTMDNVQIVILPGASIQTRQGQKACPTRRQSPSFVTLLRPMSACQMIRNEPPMTEEMTLGNSSTLGTLAPLGIPTSNLGPISNIFNSMLDDASVLCHS